MGHVVACLLAFGSYEGETPVDSGRRRIVVGALWVSLPFIVASSLSGLAKGVPLVAVIVAIQAILHLSGLIFLKQRPPLDRRHSDCDICLRCCRRNSDEYDRRQTRAEVAQLGDWT
jgi:hypothetical protein